MSARSLTASANGAERSLMLAARVHPREDANLSVGMDVRSWMRERFVDLVVVDYGGFQFDQDTDHAWIAEEAGNSGALVYSHLGRTPYDDRHHDPTIEMYRAARAITSQPGRTASTSRPSTGRTRAKSTSSCGSCPTRTSTPARTSTT